MKRIYYFLLVVRLSLRWINKLNLSDEVEYDGKRWFLNQGVRDPVWVLIRGKYQDGTFERVEVHSKDFRKVNTLRAKWRSFRAGYRFYMTSWYDIWCREGILPWMCSCPIWAGNPPRPNGENE